MVVTSIFFFSHNIFYPMKDNCNIWVTFNLSSANAFKWGKPKVLSSGKGLIPFRLNTFHASLLIYRKFRHLNGVSHLSRWVIILLIPPSIKPIVFFITVWALIKRGKVSATLLCNLEKQICHRNFDQKIRLKTCPKWKQFDSTTNFRKEFADDNLKFDENGMKFFKTEGPTWLSGKVFDS